MGRINRMVQRFGSEEGIVWQQSKTGNSVRAPFTGERGIWTLIVRWNDEETHVMCRCICSLSPSPARLPAVREYLMRANRGLLFGGFEMDHDGGPIYFRLGVPLFGTPLSPAMLKNIINCSNAAMDCYILGLVKILCGYPSPEEAIRMSQRGYSHFEAGDGAAPEESTRERRVAQIADMLKLMNWRAHEEVRGPCYLILSTKPTGSRKGEAPTGPDRHVQFHFKDSWFSANIPSSALDEGEDQRLMLANERFCREADRPDSGSRGATGMPTYSPVRCKYLYGDEQEAAGDAALVLFDVMGVLPEETLYVTASAFGEDRLDWEESKPLNLPEASD
ncbi:MAG: YbjN domain-containing protein [Planctomycetota bacterium]